MDRLHQHTSRYTPLLLPPPLLLLMAAARTVMMLWISAHFGPAALLPPLRPRCQGTCHWLASAAACCMNYKCLVTALW
jgi:hypothetical protein